MVTWCRLPVPDVEQERVNRDFNKVDKVHNEFGAWVGFDEDMEASEIIEEETL